jgi:uncharacterized membrane protein YtjA (UPF0391 family)
MLTWAITFLMLAIVAGVFAFLTVGPLAPLLLMAALAGFVATLAWHLLKHHNR